MGLFDRFKENEDKQTKKLIQDSLAADSLEDALEILATPSTFWEAVGSLRISIEHKGDDPDEVRRFRQFFAGKNWNDSENENYAVFLSMMNELWLRTTFMSLKGMTPEQISSINTNYEMLINDDVGWHHIAKTQWIASLVEKEHGAMSCTSKLFWDCWNQSTEYPEKIDKMLQQWDEETIMKFRGICS